MLTRSKLINSRKFVVAVVVVVVVVFFLVGQRP